MNENNSYIVVLPWMMSALGLSGNALLCYALIYGYSQGGQGGYFGSRTHLAESLNISRRAATDVLDRLEAAGHLSKQNVVIDGVTRCLFRAVAPAEANDKKKKSAPQEQKPAAAEKKTRRFVPPTLDDVQSYCRERGNAVDAVRFYDYYTANGWTQGHGKPIKDWRAAVRLWERERQTTQQKSVSYGNKEAIINLRRKEAAAEVAAANARYRAKMASGAYAGDIYDCVQSIPGSESVADGENGRGDCPS